MVAPIKNGINRIRRMVILLAVVIAMADYFWTRKNTRAGAPVTVKMVNPPTTLLVAFAGAHTSRLVDDCNWHCGKPFDTVRTKLLLVRAKPAMTGGDSTDNELV